MKKFDKEGAIDAIKFLLIESLVAAVGQKSLPPSPTQVENIKTLLYMMENNDMVFVARTTPRRQD